MKWWVLALFAVNGLVWFAGDLWVPGRVQVVAADRSLPRVATLKLAAELPNTGPPLTADPAATVGNRLCVRLGWFDTASGAQQAYQQIGEPGDLRSITEAERALTPLHWVIVPPQPQARALALFKDLQRQGIDSYLVTRGENTNAISLGLFQSRDAAERILEAKKRQNLNAVLVNFPRNQLSYALVFEAASTASKSNEEGWVSEFRDDFEMVEISGCEGIATAPENP